MHLSTSLPLRLPSVCLPLIVALGCGGCGSNSIDEVDAYTLKGVVKDAAGNPLAGVEVFADDTMEYNANTVGVTDEKGEYRIALAPNRVTTYRATAQVTTQWDGQSWRLSLHPDNGNAFAAADGAVRNFTWRLSGKDQQGLTYGSTIWVYRDLDDNELDLEQVEVRFEPAGPRIDGSQGEGFSMRLADGSDRVDVPLGRYSVTARHLGDEGLPVKVRIRDTGDYAPSVEAGFVSHTSYGMMELEVSSR